jgi:hypothetical protein
MPGIADAMTMTMSSEHAPDLEVRRLTIPPLHQWHTVFSTVSVLKQR